MHVKFFESRIGREINFSGFALKDQSNPFAYLFYSLACRGHKSNRRTAVITFYFPRSGSRYLRIFASGSEKKFAGDPTPCRILQTGQIEY